MDLLRFQDTGCLPAAHFFYGYFVVLGNKVSHFLIAIRYGTVVSAAFQGVVVVLKRFSQFLICELLYIFTALE